ncbi:MAG: succinyl-diaminopimelate desuccinylase [Acidimicrobiales bacterium]
MGPPAAVTALGSAAEEDELGRRLIERTAELVNIPSVSFEEGAVVDHIEALLGSCDHLELVRVGDNVVARTRLGRRSRLVLGGHTDTVPANGNEQARPVGTVLWGLGTADMKGALAIMVELALTLRDPAMDVTYVFYAREEVASVHSGLEELFQTRPDLLVGDVAVLGEPTGGAVEAGCQGTLRAKVTLRGQRAHTARPWMGRNAIHRLGALLSALASFEPRRPMVGGLQFREAMQAVTVSGGGTGNVVPDEAWVLINHRFAPDREVHAALEEVQRVVGPHLVEGDVVELVEHAPAGVPAMDHPLLAALQARAGGEVQAKLGWTDVARFSARGTPAVNFGPGDATLAHHADERVETAALVHSFLVLHGLLSDPDPDPDPNPGRDPATTTAGAR